MNIPIVDRSNYLKGLFIIAKFDGKLNNQEKEILKTTSERLGFSRDFYEETARNLLRNKYIIEEKIKFSSKEFAISFLEDAIKLANSSDSLTENKINWLRSISELNEVYTEFTELKELIGKQLTS